MYIYRKISDISGMAVEDYVNIVGHYNRFVHGPTIDPRILERGYSEAQLNQLKEQMRSNTRSITSLNIRFNRPIEEFSHPQFHYLLILHSNYTKGILPFGGALADQPAQIMEIFNTLDSLDLEIKQRQLADQKRDMDKMKRKR